VLWGACTPDGTLLATVSVDQTVRLWDVATGRARATLTGHTEAARWVVFSSDGALLATISADRTVRLWDAATGRARATLTGHTGAVCGGRSLRTAPSSPPPPTIRRPGYGRSSDLSDHL
jgi:WD40 repeat protein